MSFLHHFRPAEEQSRLCVSRQRQAHFHGGMSLRCLLDAAQLGAAALLTYLLAWHLRYLHNREWVELTNSAGSLAGLSERRRQGAIRRLSTEPQLLRIRERPGHPRLVLPLDPWPGEPYLMGYMSWECLRRAAAAYPRGPSLLVYVIAMHEYNLVKRGAPIRLGQAQRLLAGLRRSSWSRAINKLTQAELLQIYSQRHGRSPLVLPLDPWRPNYRDAEAPSLGHGSRPPTGVPPHVRAAFTSAG